MPITHTVNQRRILFYKKLQTPQQHIACDI